MSEHSDRLLDISSLTLDLENGKRQLAAVPRP